MASKVDLLVATMFSSKNDIVIQRFSIFQVRKTLWISKDFFMRIAYSKHSCERIKFLAIQNE